MEYRGTTLPNQKVAMSKKDTSWKEDSLDSILSRSKVGGVKYQRQLSAYNIMDSNFDLEDLKYVTDPYKTNESFPAKMQDINITSPKINLLLGEASKRPQNHVVFRTGEAVTKEIIEEQKGRLIEAMTQDLLSQGDPNENKEAFEAKLKEIQAEVGNEYYSAEEEAASNTLKYLRQKLQLDTEFIKGFEDGLVSNDEIYYVGLINGEPYVERVNPLSFSYDRSPELKGIETGDWAVRQMEMSSSEIHDKFYDIMDEDTFDKVLAEINEGAASSKNLTGSSINTDYIRWKDSSPAADLDFNEMERKGYTTTVAHGVWRSYKKVGYLTYTDEAGDEQTTLVDESYKADKDESIEWDWIDEVWEGYRVADDIYFGIKATQYQDYSVEDPKSLSLPYVGSWYNGNNSSGKSLVELMKPLQYFYLTLFYRLELTLARDKGKILNMDITQIPASMGMDEYKWMHYLSSAGVNFINPYEEGWDIPGREGGKAASFNQISAVDLTMGNVINEYVGLMSKVEEMIGELSGISEQRQGSISTNELVGSVERAVVQSSHITEPFFLKHNTVITSVLRLLLDVARFAWRRSDRKHIGFVLEGPERAFINLSDSFLYSDYDIFVSDASKEHQRLEALKGLYQPAMQNGASLLDIASIISSESMSEIKSKLAEIEEKNAQRAQEQTKMEQEVMEKERALKEDELHFREEDSVRKAETAIQVAMIGHSDDVDGDGYSDGDGDENDNGISDVIDLEKLELQSKKLKQDYDLKSRQLKETERSNLAKEGISKMAKRKTT